MNVNGFNDKNTYAVIRIIVWSENVRQHIMRRLQLLVMQQFVSMTRFYFMCLSRIKSRYFLQTIQLRFSGL